MDESPLYFTSSASTMHPPKHFTSSHHSYGPSSLRRSTGAGATSMSAGRHSTADDDRDNTTVTSSPYGEFIYLDDSTVSTMERGGGGDGNSNVCSMARRSSPGRSSLEPTSTRPITADKASSAAAVPTFSTEGDTSDQDDRVIFIDDDSEVFMVDSARQQPPPAVSSTSISQMPMIYEDDEIIFLDGDTHPSFGGGEPDSLPIGDCELGGDAPTPSNKGPNIDHDDEHNNNSDATSATDPVIPTTRSWFRTEENSHWFIWEFIQFQKTRSWKKKLLTVLVMLSSVYVIVDLIFLGNVQHWINTSLLWMTDHPFAASASFFGLFVVTSLMFVPITPLVFASGFCFVGVCGGSLEIGAAVAILLSFVSLVVGAVLSFLRARYMSQDIVKLFATRYPIVKAADRALQRKGFKIMLLLRLCPIIPFNGLNYIGGVTSVSLKHFTFSLVGMLPTILLWVLVGATSKSLAQKTIDDTSLQVYMGVLMGVGLWVAVLALFITWRIASKELRREIESNSAETWFRYRDDSQAPSQPDDDEDGDESGDEDEEGEDCATCTDTGTDESSGRHTFRSVDPTALAALHYDNHAAMTAPHSPENRRAASQLPRPPYLLSPLLPPDSPFSGGFGFLDGEEDDEIIFIPDPGPTATGMYDEHDLEYTEQEADGLHYYHDDYHDDYHHDYHHDYQHLHQQHPDNAYASHSDSYYPSHNWLLNQLGIGYGMDRHDPYGDPHGRDTDPLWLWA